MTQSSTALNMIPALGLLLVGCQSDLAERLGRAEAAEQARGASPNLETDLDGEDADPATYDTPKPVVRGDAGTASGEGGAGGFSEPEPDTLDGGHPAAAECPPGTFVDEGTNGRLDCSECPTGTYSATADAPECASWSTCQPGEFVAQEGTALKDQLCQACADGTWDHDSDPSTRCVEHTACTPGEFEKSPGSTDADRVCEPCGPDEHSDQINARSCVATGACSAGTVETAPATMLSPPQCGVCAAGSYCAGAQAAEELCSSNTWDHDADPATPCADKTDCVPGQFVDDDGDTTTDRECVDCPAESFSSATNASSCGAWTVCSSPGSRMSQAPSATQDRTCEACVGETVTSFDNDPTCDLPAYQMVADEVVIEAEHYYSRGTNGAVDSWYEVSNGNASGGVAMELGPDDGTRDSYTVNPEATAPYMDYNVNFTSTGTFYVHIRGDVAPLTGYSSDSCWVAIEGTSVPFDTYPQDDDSWGWETNAFAVSSIGVQTVIVYGREDGFQVDKVVINKSATAPGGAGPEESPLL